MLFSDANSRFFNPSALLYEMKVLQEILKNGYVSPTQGITRGLSEDMIQGYLAKLSEAGLVEGSCAGEGTLYRLTAAGEQRLRVLFVDYIQELVSLYGVASEVIRKRLAEYYLQGVRTVAFYPIGETAEVAYLAIRDSGLQLSIAIDDDPIRWDTAFHEVTIHPPKVLATASVDAVIVTTCVFQSEIIRNIRAINRPDLRILSI
jgi:DNA-binding PadR family transcriptional regulator